MKDDAFLCLLVAAAVTACSGADDEEFVSHGDPPTVSGEDTASSADSTGADETAGSSGADTTSGGTTPTSTTAADDTAGSDDGSDDTGETKDDVPPTGARAILPWLEARSYAGWNAESAVHPSAGPHGSVRTFVNDTLFDSMAASATVHPAQSASVKELYSGETMIGWAVSLRLDDGPGAQAWYWYELLNGSVVADGTQVAGCADCHSGGDDYVLTAFPLQ
jgi:hypothetical protein